MEAGLMKIARSLNRSWTNDNYFSLQRPSHRGENPEANVQGKCPGTGELML